MRRPSPTRTSGRNRRPRSLRAKTLRDWIDSLQIAGEPGGDPVYAKFDYTGNAVPKSRVCFDPGTDQSADRAKASLCAQATFAVVSSAARNWRSKSADGIGRPKK